MGLNETGNSRSSPTQLGSLYDWENVFAGKDHHAAIKSDGTLWMWGQAVYGQLGANDRIRYSSPVQVGSLTDWKFIALGDSHTIALR